MLTSPDFVASTPSHCGSLIQTEHHPLQEATGFPSVSGRDLKLERATDRGVSSPSLEVYKQRLLLLWLFPALSPFLLTLRILKTCFRHSAPCPDVSQGPLLPLGSSTNPPSPRQCLTGSWSVESSLGLPWAERVRP